MYSSDNAVLGASIVGAPSIFGIILWPDFALIALVGIAVIIGSLFIVFKIRNKAKN